MKNSIQIFEHQNIRAAFDEEFEMWYFSVVDVIAVLTNTNFPQRYWSDLKNRLKKNNRQPYEKIVQLKLVAEDGKRRLTDVLDTENLKNLLNFIPSKKQKKFQDWLKNFEPSISLLPTLEVPYHIDIQSLIYTVRGVQVMLDKDLADLYQVKATRLREQVKRNLKRFPPDFMFQLTEDEIEFMVSQNAIPSKQNLGGTAPMVFTEQGIANLSSVLTNDIAIEVNILIMRAFIAMRKFLFHQAHLFDRIALVEQKQIETDKRVDTIFNALESGEVKPKQQIFYDGQIFDAYKFAIDLVRKAEKSLVLIDNFVDESVLILLGNRKENVTATVYTRDINQRLALTIRKYNSQYQPINVLEFSQSHDRFLIIDDTEIYHFGASLKDLGKKWFAFSKFDIGAVEMIQKLKG